MTIGIKCNECQSKYSMVERLLNVEALSCPLLMETLDLDFRLNQKGNFATITAASTFEVLGASRPEAQSCTIIKQK